MPESILIDGLLAKEETSYGTDAVPTPSTDAVRLSERIWPKMTPQWAFPNERDDVATGGIIPAEPHNPKGRIIELDFEVELKGSGAAYSSSVLPETDPLLIGIGTARTIDTTPGSETVTYAHADTGHGSCTIYAYGGGMLFKIVGCRGSLSWPINAGQLGRVRLRMQGIVSSVTDATLPSMTYSSVKSPAAVAMALTLNPGSSWSPDFASAEFDQGVDVVRLDDGNAADAIDQFAIPKADPRFKLTARKAALATYDPYSLNASKTSHTIDYTLGAVQYNKIALDVNEAYLDADPNAVADDDFAAWELEYRVRQYAIVFS